MREVDQVKGVMSENINQAMSNLESTEALNEKTQEMKAQSNMFNKQAKTAKNQMWWKNMKVGSRHAPTPPARSANTVLRLLCVQLNIIIGCVVAVIIIIIIMQFT